MAKMPLEEKIARCLQRHPDWSDGRIAMTVTCKVADVRAIKMGLSLPQSTQEKTGLVSLRKIVERYDIRAAILRELATLPRGQLIFEADLCQKAAGTDRNRFRRTIENNADEFRVLRIKLKLDDSNEGKWYWGNPDDISEALRIRDL